jgi:inosine/xanthosine triphosphatase
MKSKNFLTIGLASRNPIKVEAAKNAFERSFRRPCRIQFPEKLDFPHQPLNLEATLQGALERAKRALKISNAEFGVGMEGGVAKIPKSTGEPFIIGWVAIRSIEGRISTAQTTTVPLPSQIFNELQNHPEVELGTIIDRLSGRRNTKQKSGAVGILTENLVVRRDLFEQALICALWPFLQHSKGIW